LENIPPLGFQNLVVAKVATFTTTEFLMMWLSTLCKNPKILKSLCLNAWSIKKQQGWHLSLFWQTLQDDKHILITGEIGYIT
jgi:hypothetical protein